MVSEDGECVHKSEYIGESLGFAMYSGWPLWLVRWARSSTYQRLSDWKIFRMGANVESRLYAMSKSAISNEICWVLLRCSLVSQLQQCPLAVCTHLNA